MNRYTRQCKIRAKPHDRETKIKNLTGLFVEDKVALWVRCPQHMINKYCVPCFEF